jgi:predicted DNA-binding mobile mystery protein A
MKDLNARRSLDKKLSSLREEAKLARPHRGWVKAIREALGMTTAQLARRMGVSQPRITELEYAEIGDKVTLGTLRRAAEAMNCTLVYAIVPVKSSLEETLLDRARHKAARILGDVNHTMVLENQNLTQEEIKGELEDLANSLISKKVRILWDEKP